MFKYDTTGVGELSEELFDDVSIDIMDMADVASEYAVNNSPVDTGLFKGNWNASINEEYTGATIFEDPEGSETISNMKQDIDSFDLRNDKEIHIQNNVYNPDDEEHYAATVSFDFTTETAESIVSGAIITAMESKQ